MSQPPCNASDYSSLTLFSLFFHRSRNKNLCVGVHCMNNLKSCRMTDFDLLLKSRVIARNSHDLKNTKRSLVFS